MYRAEQQYAGVIAFRYVNADYASDEEWALIRGFFSNSIPAFGFFDARGDLVGDMAGWNAQVFERRVQELAGMH